MYYEVENLDISHCTPLCIHASAQQFTQCAQGKAPKGIILRYQLKSILIKCPRLEGTTDALKKPHTAENQSEG